MVEGWNLIEWNIFFRTSFGFDIPLINSNIPITLKIPSWWKYYAIWIDKFYLPKYKLAAIQKPNENSS